MIICPVCEHQQAQGVECDMCGKRFTAVGTPAVAVARLPELEQTQLAGGRAPVATASIPDLELTRQRSSPDVAVQPVPELETTRRASAGNVMVAPLQELDTGRAPMVGAKTAMPTTIVCRYCRNVQANGAICERCGMRLPRPRMENPAARAPGQLPEVGAWVTCPKCHAHMRAGRACTDCGTPIPAAD
jgi:ribosomal protein L32